MTAFKVELAFFRFDLSKVHLSVSRHNVKFSHDGSVHQRSIRNLYVFSLLSNVTYLYSYIKRAEMQKAGAGHMGNMSYF